MSVTLEVGKTYLMADGTQVKIGHMGGLWTPIFRISADHPDYWFKAGSHKSGNEALRLIVEAPSVPVPVAPVLGRKVMIEYDVDTNTARVL